MKGDGPQKGLPIVVGELITNCAVSLDHVQAVTDADRRVPRT